MDMAVDQPRHYKLVGQVDQFFARKRLVILCAYHFCDLAAFDADDFILFRIAVARAEKLSALDCCFH